MARTTVHLDDESAEIFRKESSRLGLSVSAYLRALARKIREGTKLGGRLL